MVFIAALIVFIVVMGYLDSRLRWPKPTEKRARYVSISERSSTLRPGQPSRAPARRGKGEKE